MFYKSTLSITSIKLFYKPVCFLLILLMSSCLSQVKKKTSQSDNPVGSESIEMNSPFGIIDLKEKNTSGYELVYNLGVKWVRCAGSVGAKWDNIENEGELGQGNYNWESTDSTVSNLTENGFNILWTIDYFNSIDQGINIQDIENIGRNFPNNIEAYKKFITALVKRYNGNNGLPAVNYWQIGNELNLRHNWSGTIENLASLIDITYKIIKIANPSAKVVLGGASNPFALNVESGAINYHDLLNELKNIGGTIDVFDIHWYGYIQNYKAHHKNRKQTLKDFLIDLKNSLVGLGDVDVWMTESGTYTGSTVNMGQGLVIAPEQTESKHAAEILKRYIYSLANGIKKIFWFTVTESAGYSVSFQHNDYFDNMGLIYNGCAFNLEINELECNPDIGFGDDLGEGVKKLAYYTYKLMIDKLENSNWDSIEEIQNTNNIYIYKLTNRETNNPVWVAWNDNSVSQEIILNIGNKNSVEVTEAVSKYTIGKDVIDYNTAFNVTSKATTNGLVSILLKESPVFIELN